MENALNGQLAPWTTFAQGKFSPTDFISPQTFCHLAIFPPSCKNKYFPLS
jgi:hypothetical protein